MPHLGFTCPLSEFYLALERRDKPRGSVFGLHFLVERLLVGPQWLHRFINRLQRCLVEAGANVPEIYPSLIRFVADRKHQRAKVFARPARLSVAHDPSLLLMHRLELEPLARPLAPSSKIPPRAWRSPLLRALAAPWRTPVCRTRRRVRCSAAVDSAATELSGSFCAQAAVFRGCPCRPQKARRKQHRVTRLSR